MSVFCGASDGAILQDLAVNHVAVTKSMRVNCADMTKFAVTDVSAMFEDVVNLDVDNLVIGNSLNICTDSPPGTILVSDENSSMNCLQPTGAEDGSFLTFTGDSVTWSKIPDVFPSLQLVLSGAQPLNQSDLAPLTWTAPVAADDVNFAFINNTADVNLVYPGSYLITYNIYCDVAGGLLFSGAHIATDIKTEPSFDTTQYPLSQATLPTPNSNAMLTYNYIINTTQANTLLNVDAVYAGSVAPVARTGQLSILRLAVY